MTGGLHGFDEGSDDGTVRHPEPSPAASVADTGQAADAAGGPERSRWATVAIVAYSSALALGAVALLLWGPLDGASAIRILVPQPAMFAACLRALGGGLWAPVSVHHRGNTGISPSRGPVGPRTGVPADPPCSCSDAPSAQTIVFVVVHRSPLIRVFFNTASAILSVAVAAVVFRELLAGHSPVSLRGWAAIAVAVCTKELLATLNFQVVTRLNGQAPEAPHGFADH